MQETMKILSSVQCGAGSMFVSPYQLGLVTVSCDTMGHVVQGELIHLPAFPSSVMGRKQ